MVEIWMKTYYLMVVWIAILVALVSVLMFGFQRKTRKIMEMNISGGFAGMNMNFEYYSNGSVVFNDLRRDLRNSTLVPSQVVEELKGRINLLLNAYPDGLKLEPGGGADYFIYVLSVYNGGRKITYRWADIGEKPRELAYLADLLRRINDHASGSGEIIFYVKADKLEVERGGVLRISVMAINPSQRDFCYHSPTPCSPDFKVYLYAQENEVTELFPMDYDSSGQCIQVVQERVLKAGETISSTYECTFKEEGTYAIEARFPYADWSQRQYISRITIVVS